MSSIKKTMSALLAVGMLAASAVTAAAENAEPTMPDLTVRRAYHAGSDGAKISYD